MSERAPVRGQTTQDYAIGIGLFLLIVVFALTFLPAILTPFETIDEDQREAQAERVANAIVDRAAVEGQRVHLNETVLTGQLSMTDTPGAFGLTDTIDINATLRSLSSDARVGSGGSAHDGQAIGTWARIVSTESGACTTGCRLAVRVW